ncbi:MAG: RagB/SusD family nutrient uptake outer membrane protein [Saprospiraceae bacterium]
MKIEINKKLRVITVVAVFLISACGKDFLDLNPHQSIALDQAIQTIDDYQAAVYGTYSALQSADYYGRYFVLVPDVMSDDVKQNAQANRARDFSDYQATALDGIATGMWEIMYDAINRANLVINAEVELAAAVQDQKDEFIGEAHTLRALAHFDLVRMFAQHYGYTEDNSHPGVAIVTSFDQNARPERSSVSEVYQQIVDDLMAAIPLLKVDPGSASRFSAEGAKALLARVMLYMGNYQLAGQMASEVINSGKYSLVPTDQYVASWNQGLSSESIFEVVFRADDDNGSDALGRMYLPEGYGDYLPAADLLDLIPEGDVRKGLFKTDATIGGVYGNLRVNKYPNAQNQNNTPVLRLSEMYLIRAEARAILGDEAGAREDVTTIRQRGLPSASAVTASGQALLDEIAKEKRIEMMFEGQRLWELMRHKENLVRSDCTNLVCEVDYPDNRFVAPIPQAELDANENMAQNPGY